MRLVTQQGGQTGGITLENAAKIFLWAIGGAVALVGIYYSLVRDINSKASKDELGAIIEKHENGVVHHQVADRITRLEESVAELSEHLARVEGHISENSKIDQAQLKILRELKKRPRR